MTLVRESFQAIFKPAVSKQHFLRGGGLHSLNVQLFGGLGIYSWAIIYEMWVQVNNAMHVPTVNNKNQEM